MKLFIDELNQLGTAPEFELIHHVVLVNSTSARREAIIKDPARRFFMMLRGLGYSEDAEVTGSQLKQRTCS